MKGYFMIKNKKSYNNSTVSFKDGSTLTYQETNYNYSYENMPAFVSGEYLTTAENYISKVVFEISSFEIPGRVYKNYNTSWADVNKLFLDGSDFGGRLKAINFCKDDISNINQLNLAENDKMNAVFNLVKGKTTWNKRNSSWTSQSLKKTYENGEGNSADINLLLVALLNEAGMKAYPVTLSTRSNGVIFPSHPSISQMNYVVCLCKVNGKNILLDATEKFAAPNILPTRCLNGEGRVISTEWSDWIPLLNGNKMITETKYNLKLDLEGDLSGSINKTGKEFAAFSKRNSIDE